jgi:hypothetical protein
MLRRCLFAATSVTLCSALFWAGCGGSADIPGPVLGTTDAGHDHEVAESEPDASSTTTPDAKGADQQDANTDAPLPAPVSVTYGTCPAFTGCGGDVVGTWKVTGGCVSDTTFADAKTGDCAGVEEGNVDIQAAGLITATATTFRRRLDVTLKADLSIPPACVQYLGGTCNSTEIGLTLSIGPDQPALFDDAKCTSDGAGGCNCKVKRAYNEDETHDYSVDGSTLTTTDPDRTFAYCVAGTKTTMQETTAGTLLPVIVETEKQ